AAVRAGSALDHLLMGVAVLGISTPVFWLGLMLQLVVAVRLGWLPVSGYGDGTLTHLILPAFALGALHTGTVARMTRSSLLAFALVYVLGNLLVDLAYLVIDPRIRDAARA